jgi:tRNA dimethylallyltransferase
MTGEKEIGRRLEEKPKVIAVVGPTVVGKTGLVLRLAEEIGAEVVNADSMQVYRFMDIGTAKPTPAVRAKVPHHLLDIVNPDEHFDANLYSQFARKVVQNLVRRGTAAIAAGGTGLYLKASFYGLFPGAPADRLLRERLRREAVDNGGVGLYQRLSQVDPAAARRIHPNDLFRIIRALEVWYLRGKPITQMQVEHAFRERPFYILKIGLRRARPELHELINRRVELMMEQGFLEEVRGLLKRGYGPHLKSMQSLGYRHMVQHLTAGLDISEALRTMKRDTRRYAKRQMTWFRRDQETNWFHPEEVQSIVTLARRFLNQPNLA